MLVVGLCARVVGINLGATGEVVPADLDVDPALVRHGPLHLHFAMMHSARQLTSPKGFLLLFGDKFDLDGLLGVDQLCFHRLCDKVEAPT